MSSAAVAAAAGVGRRERLPRDRKRSGEERRQPGSRHGREIAGGGV